MHSMMYKRGRLGKSADMSAFVHPSVGTGWGRDELNPESTETVPALRIEWRDKDGKSNQLLVSDMSTLESLLEVIRTVKRDLDKHYARKLKNESK